DYHVGSVAEIPLGGSQSAACHLAPALGVKGHHVFFFNALSMPGIYAGVNCRNWGQVSVAEASALGLDVVVCVLAAGRGQPLREVFRPKALILWNQHASDPPAVRALHDLEECAAYDAFAMVSEWQRGEFAQCFAIEPERMAIRRNAIAPP